MRGFAMGSALMAAALASPARAADAGLVAAAKKEGQVVWLGTQAVDDLARPLFEAFEAKYGIKVLYQRVTVTEIVLKVSAEAAAGAHNVDFVDGTFTSQALKKKGLLLDWTPDPAARYPADYVDPQRQWVALNLYYATPAFNTDLVPKGTEPKTLDDLLDPKWRGKIAWSSVAGSASGAGFIGALLREKGEAEGMAWLRAFAAQKPIGVPTQARALLDQVRAGEYAIQLQNFNSQVVVAKAKGAPVDWIPMNPATGVLIVGSVVKDSPHPNAAKLLFDFLVSPEGQGVFRDHDYIPADPSIEPRDPSARPDGKSFRAIVFPPEEVEARMPKWLGIFADLFR
jgi:iron(III) transport system substrate-binding protein